MRPLVGLLLALALAPAAARAQDVEPEHRPVPATPAPAPATLPASTPAPAPSPAAASVQPAPSPATAPPPPPPGRIVGSVSVLGKGDQRKPGEGAIAYLEAVPRAQWGGRRAVPAQPKITMKDKRFGPRAVPVLVGKSVSFPNLDPIHHNVFSLSGGNKFDLGLYKDGNSKDHVFESPGVVRIFCNIHPSMAAYVLVLQNPFWATVGDDGAYKIDGVPPGAWSLKVWHERGGESSQPVAVKAGQSVTADFELDGRKFKVLPHKNKLGHDYPTDGY